jgi:hypothetical protein
MDPEVEAVETEQKRGKRNPSGGGEGATLFSHTWEAAQATARTSTTVTTNRQGDAINAKHKGY